MNKFFKISTIVCVLLSIVFLILVMVPLLNGEYQNYNDKTREYLDKWLNLTFEVSDYETKLEDLERSREIKAFALGTNSSVVKNLDNEIYITKARIRAAEAEGNIAHGDYMAYNNSFAEIKNAMIINGVLSGISFIMFIVFLVMGIKKAK